MDIQQYISSGVLELYVLQQLPATEMQEVDALRKQYPAINTEILNIQDAFENLALANAKKAPARIKEKVLAEIKTETFNTNINSAPAEKNNIFKIWAIAASALLCIAGAYLFTLQNKLNNSQAKIAEVEQTINSLNKDIAVYNNPQFIKVNLGNTDTTVQGNLAQVFWNKTNQEVYINVLNQKPLDADKQYQLWALADGKPVDAGVIDINNKLQKAKLIKNAQAFAITIEKKGGSPTPTLTALVALGKI
jgi:anti-sigma-K factor RskA